MKIKAVHQYAKDVDTVFGLFHDPAFMKVKYEGIGARNVEVLECAGSEGRYTVQVKREVPADVPSLLKKFLNPWNTIVQSETWEGKAGGPYRCKFTVEIASVPVSMSGEPGCCAADVAHQPILQSAQRQQAAELHIRRRADVAQPTEQPLVHEHRVERRQIAGDRCDAAARRACPRICGISRNAAARRGSSSRRR